MARAKTQADEIYNTRRRAKRYSARLQKQLETTVGASARKELRMQIRNLEKQIAQTYAPTKTTKAIGKAKENVILRRKQKQLLVIEQLKKTVPSRKSARDLRISEIWKKALAAPREALSTAILGAHAREKQNLFWYFTKKIWQGAPVHERYQRIMNYYGVSNIKDAFEKVMQEYGITDEQISNVKADVTSTAESDFYNDGAADENLIEEHIGTPIELIANFAPIF